MSSEKVKIGIIGCGNISSIYFKAGETFDILDIVACSDLVKEKAEEQGEKYNIPKVCSVEDLLEDPQIKIVVNLTTPDAHKEVAMAAIQAGKSVYNEKPLTIALDDGRNILDAAKDRGVLVGCAPDTFLGGGLQTCRKLIDDGWIGTPIGATAFMMNHGHESWHPAPEFYYKAGGGPMFDMGPYYLTALVNLIGPVSQVTGSAKISIPQRIITSEPKYGTRIKVDVPTHIAGIMEFCNGAVGTIITSFDVWASEVPRIEIYGTEGSLSVPDPNTFGGPVKIKRAGDEGWSEVPLAYGYAENSRGLGVADMAYALRLDRIHRANGELAYHVLEIMHGFHISSQQGKFVKITSSPDRPLPLPLGLNKGEVEKSG